MKVKLYNMILAGWRGKDFNKEIHAQSQNMNCEQYDEFYNRAVEAYEFGRENADEYACMEEALYLGDETEDFSGLLAREESILSGVTYV